MVTGKDQKYHDGHKVVIAAISPVFAEIWEADLVVLADWSSDDYCILLDLFYSGERFVGVLTTR